MEKLHLLDHLFQGEQPFGPTASSHTLLFFQNTFVMPFYKPNKRVIVVVRLFFFIPRHCNAQSNKTNMEVLENNVLTPRSTLDYQYPRNQIFRCHPVFGLGTAA